MYIRNLIQSTLSEMGRVLHQLQNGERVERVGQSGDIDNDEELLADKRLGETAIGLLSTSQLFNKIVVEGQGVHHCENKDGLIAYVDPLDASLDYKVKGNTSILPYSGVITIVENVEQHEFSKIYAAGVMNFSNSNRDYWAAGDNFLTTINDLKAKPFGGPLGLTNCPVIGEMYYPSNREKVVKAFSGQNGYLRSVGSAAIEMAMVASGQVSAFICDQQKGHELGAAYALVTKAGGVVVDWQGRDIGYDLYDFGGRYEVVVAASQEAADWVLNLINKP